MHHTPLHNIPPITQYPQLHNTPNYTIPKTQVELLQQRLADIATTPTAAFAQQLEALQASQAAVQEAVQQLVVMKEGMVVKEGVGEGEVVVDGSGTLKPVLDTLQALTGMWLLLFCYCCCFVVVVVLLLLVVLCCWCWCWWWWWWWWCCWVQLEVHGVYGYAGKYTF